jgi:hypothetical protein
MHSGIAEAHFSSLLALVRYFYQSAGPLSFRRFAGQRTADQRTKIAVCPPLIYAVRLPALRTIAENKSEKNCKSLSIS